ncbi:MAG: fucose isomerase, partial [Spirochaetales bacterium]
MKSVFGLIIGNRGFFPAQLVREGREDILKALKACGCGAVVLDEKDSQFGSVETLEDAKKCAALFRKNAEKIDGIIISLPNFGDERAAAGAIQMSG